MSTQTPSLRDDVLGPGVAKIAEYAPDTVRRIRHLIDRDQFPHFRVGSFIYSRKSWLDRFYSGQPVDTAA
jgi:hypothetical protein